jgi:DNA-binding PadR family transcriptional regulator
VPRARGLTTLEHALLGLAAEEERTGYALRRVFETTPMGHYGGSPGAIYPALRRLERRRLVVGRRAPGRRGRGARVFAATPAGRRAVADWAAAPVTREDAVWRADELLLRFAFLDPEGDDATLRFLGEYRAAMAAVRADLEAWLAGPGAALGRARRLAVGHGIASAAANERWAAAAERALRRASRTDAPSRSRKGGTR